MFGANYAFATNYVNKRGWSVIPVGKDKKPLIQWEPYQAERPSLVTLQDWFRRFPNAQVGVVTGKVSNLAIVDVDSFEGLELVRERKADETLSSRTQKGWHFFFSFPDGGVRNSAKLFDGIDIRGEGGYAVVPPSVGLAGQYRWLNPDAPVAPLPSWVLEAGSKPPLPASAPPSSDLIQHGQRHDYLVRVAGSLRRYGVSPEQIFDHLKQVFKARCVQVPHVPDENLRRIAFSMERYPATYTPPTVPALSLPEKPLRILMPSEGLSEYEERLRERASNPTPQLPTGLRDLDNLTWGLKKGNVFTVAGRPGIGKTSLLLNVVTHLCAKGKSVLVFSTEMDFGEIYDKLMSLILGTQGVTFKGASAEMVGRFKSVISGYRLGICDGFKPEIEQVRQAVLEHKPDVFVFDHIQHIGGATQHRVQELSNFVRGLKSLAREADVACLCASQLNRVAEYEEPALHHLKECGTIEDESSIVALLSKAVQQPADCVPVKINVAKNRFGPCGAVQAMFNKPYSKFENLGV